MRATILRCGGEVHFQTKMTSLLTEGNKVIGVEALSPQPSALSHHTYLGPVILATGHSARDVYRYLADARVEIESKGIAVGVWSILQNSSTRYNTTRGRVGASTCRQPNTRLSHRSTDAASTRSACAPEALSFLPPPTRNRLWSTA